ncbi:MAG TPA: hypothetical protein VIM23_03140 [Gaiellaceae bacterium]
MSGRGRAPDSQDLFAQLPLRLHEAVRRGELTFHQFGLVAYLVGAADYRTGELATTVAALADAIQWGRSDDTLRRDLQALKAAGWIDYSVQERQRRPYILKLVGALRDGTASATAASNDPSMRQTASPVRQFQDAAFPHGERERASTLEPACGSPVEETRTDAEENDNPGIEEELDHRVGEETTRVRESAGGDAVTERMLGLVAANSVERDEAPWSKLHAAAETSARRQVRAWVASRPLPEAEQAFLAELVDTFDARLHEEAA